MGFSLNETVNIDRKISAGVVDSSSSSQWYDSQLAFIPSILNKNVLTQYDQIPSAATKTAAQTNATNNPTLLQDKSQNASAVRLTVISGTGNSTYVATSTYGNYGEASRLRNWIHPVKIPQSSGAPSAGYAIRVFQGNPASGGVEVLTSTGLTGSGVTATPAWIFNYDQGILLISDDYKATLTNPYILGFRYIGQSLTDTLAAINNSSTQAEVDLIESSIGLTTGGNFTAPSGTTYLDGATSVMNSAVLLDAAILSVLNSLNAEVTNRTNADIALQNQITSLPAGAQGPQGIQGLPGLSAYQLAVDAGFNGTVADWLLTLVGVAGATGVDGKSAYQLAIDDGFVGSVTEWLDSLKGTATAASSGIFVLDVTPTSSGVVGVKTHPVTVPANKVLSTCVSDTPNIRVTLGVDGSATSYSPTVTIAGVQATITETSTARWFTAVADIVISSGTTTINAITNSGATTSFEVTLAGAGPSILGIAIGAYPNSQTALKAGDTLTVTVTTEPEAVEITLLSGGASSVTRTFPVIAGEAICSLVIGTASGAQAFTFKAKNSLGTYGNNYTSATVSLDQVVPTFGTLTVTYPATQNALKTGESATVNCVVNNASSVTYSATNLQVIANTTYAASKTVNLTGTGYVDSGNNYTITAVKASNNSTVTKNGLVNIATTAPTGSIATSPSGRMVGSITGVDYTVVITSSQNLQNAPTLTASAGAWVGGWSGSNKTWSRLLRIDDTTPKGNAFFSELVITNMAGVVGNTIAAGANYVVGGLSSRVLTFPAFSRVVAIGTTVSNTAKTTCQILGGNVLTFYPDNQTHINGYYIADSDGAYNPNGAYVGLSDAAFAGSNTTGTLQITFAESA